MSLQAADLIKRSLSYAEDRISMREILQHPWFLTRLPPNALRMNDELLVKNAEIMKTVESRQSERTVKKTIQAVRLGKDPTSSRFSDKIIDELFDDELKRRA